MKFRKQVCPFCDHEGRPVKGTKGRAKHKGMTPLCVSCRGPLE